MGRRRPTKDQPHDPAPYAALAAEQQTGHDIKQTLADLIVTTDIRPGLMASRLNLAGITGTTGSAWTWVDVRDAKDRAVLEQASKGNFLRPIPGGGCVTRVGRSGWERTWG